MAINLYDTYDHARREAAHVAYIATPEFPALVEKAAALGFRHASLGEIHSSADSAHFAPDLHCWRGGLWVRSTLAVAAEAEDELFTCKYCGAASKLDPKDQEPPADYCHPSDHGSV